MNKEEKVVWLYRNGHSMRQISSSEKISRNTIKKILVEHQVDIRYTNITSRKFHHNESFFEEINTEEKAYWLGFIYADGFITSKRENGSQSLGITLSKKDKEHIQKFKNDIEATNPINDYIGSGFNEEGEFSRILLVSQKTVDDLKRHGVVENKTKILTFPNTIPQHLIHHFIRGYMDGDGSIYKSFDNKGYENYHVSFLGTEEFLRTLSSYLEVEKEPLESKGVCELKYGGNKQAKRILDILYEDAHVFLERKKVRYDMLTNSSKDGVQIG